jgi:hypothetical protein
MEFLTQLLQQLVNSQKDLSECIYNIRDTKKRDILTHSMVKLNQATAKFLPLNGKTWYDELKLNEKEVLDIATVAKGRNDLTI